MFRRAASDVAGRMLTRYLDALFEPAGPTPTQPTTSPDDVDEPLDDPDLDQAGVFEEETFPPATQRLFHVTSSGMIEAHAVRVRPSILGQMIDSAALPVALDALSVRIGRVAIRLHISLQPTIASAALPAAAAAAAASPSSSASSASSSSGGTEVLLEDVAIRIAIPAAAAAAATTMTSASGAVSRESRPQAGSAAASSATPAAPLSGDSVDEDSPLAASLRATLFHWLDVRLRTLGQLPDSELGVATRSSDAAAGRPSSSAPAPAPAATSSASPAVSAEQAMAKALQGSRIASLWMTLERGMGLSGLRRRIARHFTDTHLPALLTSSRVVLRRVTTRLVAGDHVAVVTLGEVALAGPAAAAAAIAAGRHAPRGASASTAAARSPADGGGGSGAVIVACGEGVHLFPAASTDFGAAAEDSSSTTLTERHSDGEHSVGSLTSSGGLAVLRHVQVRAMPSARLASRSRAPTRETSPASSVPDSFDQSPPSPLRLASTTPPSSRRDLVASRASAKTASSSRSASPAHSSETEGGARWMADDDSDRMSGGADADGDEPLEHQRGVALFEGHGPSVELRLLTSDLASSDPTVSVGLHARVDQAHLSRRTGGAASHTNLLTIARIGDTFFRWARLCITAWRFVVRGASVAAAHGSDNADPIRDVALGPYAPRPSTILAPLIARAGHLAQQRSLRPERSDRRRSLMRLPALAACFDLVQARRRSTLRQMAQRAAAGLIRSSGEPMDDLPSVWPSYEGASSINLVDGLSVRRMTATHIWLARARPVAQELAAVTLVASSVARVAPELPPRAVAPVSRTWSWFRKARSPDPSEPVEPPRAASAVPVSAAAGSESAGGPLWFQRPWRPVAVFATVDEASSTAGDCTAWARTAWVATRAGDRSNVWWVSLGLGAAGIAITSATSTMTSRAPQAHVPCVWIGERWEPGAETSSDNTGPAVRLMGDWTPPDAVGSTPTPPSELASITVPLFRRDSALAASGAPVQYGRLSGALVVGRAAVVSSPFALQRLVESSTLAVTAITEWFPSLLQSSAAVFRGARGAAIRGIRSGAAGASAVATTAHGREANPVFLGAVMLVVSAASPTMVLCPDYATHCQIVGPAVDSEVESAAPPPAASSVCVVLEAEAVRVILASSAVMKDAREMFDQLDRDPHAEAAATEAPRLRQPQCLGAAACVATKAAVQAASIAAICHGAAMPTCSTHVATLQLLTRITGGSVQLIESRQQPLLWRRLHRASGRESPDATASGAFLVSQHLAGSSIVTMTLRIPDAPRLAPVALAHAEVIIPQIQARLPSGYAPALLALVTRLLLASDAAVDNALRVLRSASEARASQQRDSMLQSSHVLRKERYGTEPARSWPPALRWAIETHVSGLDFAFLPPDRFLADPPSRRLSELPWAAGYLQSGPASRTLPKTAGLGGSPLALGARACAQTLAARVVCLDDVRIASAVIDGASLRAMAFVADVTRKDRPTLAADARVIDVQSSLSGSVGAFWTRSLTAGGHPPVAVVASGLTDGVILSAGARVSQIEPLVDDLSRDSPHASAGTARASGSTPASDRIIDAARVGVALVVIDAPSLRHPTSSALTATKHGVLAASSVRWLDSAFRDVAKVAESESKGAAPLVASWVAPKPSALMHMSPLALAAPTPRIQLVIAPSIDDQSASPFDDADDTDEAFLASITRGDTNAAEHACIVTHRLNTIASVPSEAYVWADRIHARLSAGDVALLLGASMAAVQRFAVGLALVGGAVAAQLEAAIRRHAQSFSGAVVATRMAAHRALRTFLTKSTAANQQRSSQRRASLAASIGSNGSEHGGASLSAEDVGSRLMDALPRSSRKIRDTGSATAADDASERASDDLDGSLDGSDDASQRHGNDDGDDNGGGGGAEDELEDDGYDDADEDFSAARAVLRAGSAELTLHAAMDALRPAVLRLRAHDTEVALAGRSLDMQSAVDVSFVHPIHERWEPFLEQTMFTMSISIVSAPILAAAAKALLRGGPGAAAQAAQRALARQRASRRSVGDGTLARIMLAAPEPVTLHVSPAFMTQTARAARAAHALFRAAVRPLEQLPRTLQGALGLNRLASVRIPGAGPGSAVSVLAQLTFAAAAPPAPDVAPGDEDRDSPDLVGSATGLTDDEPRRPRWQGGDDITRPEDRADIERSAQQAIRVLAQVERSLASALLAALNDDAGRYAELRVVNMTGSDLRVSIDDLGVVAPPGMTDSTGSLGRVDDRIVAYHGGATLIEARGLRRAKASAQRAAAATAMVALWDRLTKEGDDAERHDAKTPAQALTAGTSAWLDVPPGGWERAGSSLVSLRVTHPLYTMKSISLAGVGPRSAFLERRRSIASVTPLHRNAAREASLEAPLMGVVSRRDGAASIALLSSVVVINASPAPLHIGSASAEQWQARLLATDPMAADSSSAGSSFGMTISVPPGGAVPLPLGWADAGSLLSFRPAAEPPSDETDTAAHVREWAWASICVDRTSWAAVAQRSALQRRQSSDLRRRSGPAVGDPAEQLGSTASDDSAFSIASPCDTASSGAPPGRPVEMGAAPQESETGQYPSHADVAGWQPRMRLLALGPRLRKVALLGPLDADDRPYASAQERAMAIHATQQLTAEALGKAPRQDAPTALGGAASAVVAATSWGAEYVAVSLPAQAVRPDGAGPVAVAQQGVRCMLVRVVARADNPAIVIIVRAPIRVTNATPSPLLVAAHRAGAATTPKTGTLDEHAAAAHSTSDEEPAANVAVAVGGLVTVIGPGATMLADSAAIGSRPLPASARRAGFTVGGGPPPTSKGSIGAVFPVNPGASVGLMMALDDARRLSRRDASRCGLAGEWWLDRTHVRAAAIAGASQSARTRAEALFEAYRAGLDPREHSLGDGLAERMLDIIHEEVSEHRRRSSVTSSPRPTPSPLDLVRLLPFRIPFFGDSSREEPRATTDAAAEPPWMLSTHGLERFINGEIHRAVAQEAERHTPPDMSSIWPGAVLSSWQVRLRSPGLLWSGQLPCRLLLPFGSALARLGDPPPQLASSTSMVSVSSSEGGIGAAAAAASASPATVTSLGSSDYPLASADPHGPRRCRPVALVLCDASRRSMTLRVSGAPKLAADAGTLDPFSQADGLLILGASSAGVSAQSFVAGTASWLAAGAVAHGWDIGIACPLTVINATPLPFISSVPMPVPTGMTGSIRQRPIPAPLSPFDDDVEVFAMQPRISTEIVLRDEEKPAWSLSSLILGVRNRVEHRWGDELWLATSHAAAAMRSATDPALPTSKLLGLSARPGDVALPSLTECGSVDGLIGTTCSWQWADDDWIPRDGFEGTNSSSAWSRIGSDEASEAMALESFAVRRRTLHRKRRLVLVSAGPTGDGVSATLPASSLADWAVKGMGWSEPESVEPSPQEQVPTWPEASPWSPTESLHAAVAPAEPGIIRPSGLNQDAQVAAGESLALLRDAQVSTVVPSWWPSFASLPATASVMPVGTWLPPVSPGPVVTPVNIGSALLGSDESIRAAVAWDHTAVHLHARVANDARLVQAAQSSGRCHVHLRLGGVPQGWSDSWAHQWGSLVGGGPWSDGVEVDLGDDAGPAVPSKPQRLIVPLSPLPGALTSDVTVVVRPAPVLESRVDELRPLLASVSAASRPATELATGNAMSEARELDDASLSALSDGTKPGDSKGWLRSPTFTMHSPAGRTSSSASMAVAHLPMSCQVALVSPSFVIINQTGRSVEIVACDPATGARVEGTEVCLGARGIPEPLLLFPPRSDDSAARCIRLRMRELSVSTHGWAEHVATTLEWSGLLRLTPETEGFTAMLVPLPARPGSLMRSLAASPEPCPVSPAEHDLTSVGAVRIDSVLAIRVTAARAAVTGSLLLTLTVETATDELSGTSSAPAPSARGISSAAVAAAADLDRGVDGSASRESSASLATPAMYRVENRSSAAVWLRQKVAGSSTADGTDALSPTTPILVVPGQVAALGWVDGCWSGSDAGVYHVRAVWEGATSDWLGVDLYKVSAGAIRSSLHPIGGSGAGRESLVVTVQCVFDGPTTVVRIVDGDVATSGAGRIRAPSKPGSSVAAPTSAGDSDSATDQLEEGVALAALSVTLNRVEVTLVSSRGEETAAAYMDGMDASLEVTAGALSLSVDVGAVQVDALGCPPGSSSGVTMQAALDSGQSEELDSVGLVPRQGFAPRVLFARRLSTDESEAVPGAFASETSHMRIRVLVSGRRDPQRPVLHVRHLLIGMEPSDLALHGAALIDVSQSALACMNALSAGWQHGGSAPISLSWSSSRLNLLGLPATSTGVGSLPLKPWARNELVAADSIRHSHSAGDAADGHAAALSARHTADSGAGRDDHHRFHPDIRVDVGLALQSPSPSRGAASSTDTRIDDARIGLAVLGLWWWIESSVRATQQPQLARGWSSGDIRRSKSASAQPRSSQSAAEMAMSVLRRRLAAWPLVLRARARHFALLVDDVHMEPLDMRVTLRWDRNIGALMLATGLFEAGILGRMGSLAVERPSGWMQALLHHVLSSVGSVAVHVRHAPLVVPDLRIRELHTTPQNLFVRVRRHVEQAIIAGVPLFFASSESLGNPLRMAQNLQRRSRQVADHVMKAARGRLRSDSEGSTVGSPATRIRSRLSSVDHSVASDSFVSEINHSDAPSSGVALDLTLTLAGRAKLGTVDESSERNHDDSSSGDDEPHERPGSIRRGPPATAPQVPVVLSRGFAPLEVASSLGMGAATMISTLATVPLALGASTTRVLGQGALAITGDGAAAAGASVPARKRGTLAAAAADARAAVDHDDDDHEALRPRRVSRSRVSDTDAVDQLPVVDDEPEASAAHVHLEAEDDDVTSPAPPSGLRTWHGLRGFAGSVAAGVGEGLVGVFRDPVRGAQSGGLSGLLGGLGRGAAGAVTRPVAGLALGMSQLFRSLEADVNGTIDRLYEPEDFATLDKLTAKKSSGRGRRGITDALSGISDAMFGEGASEYPPRPLESPSVMAVRAEVRRRRTALAAVFIAADNFTVMFAHSLAEVVPSHERHDHVAATPGARSQRRTRAIFRRRKPGAQLLPRRGARFPWGADGLLLPRTRWSEVARRVAAGLVLGEAHLRQSVAAPDDSPAADVTSAAPSNSWGLSWLRETPSRTRGTEHVSVILAEGEFVVYHACWPSPWTRARSRGSAVSADSSTVAPKSAESDHDVLVITTARMMLCMLEPPFEGNQPPSDEASRGRSCLAGCPFHAWRVSVCWEEPLCPTVGNLDEVTKVSSMAPTDSSRVAAAVAAARAFDGCLASLVASARQDLQTSAVLHDERDSASVASGVGVPPAALPSAARFASIGAGMLLGPAGIALTESSAWQMAGSLAECDAIIASAVDSAHTAAIAVAAAGTDAVAIDPTVRWAARLVSHSMRADAHRSTAPLWSVLAPNALLAPLTGDEAIAAHMDLSRCQVALAGISVLAGPRACMASLVQANQLLTEAWMSASVRAGRAPPSSPHKPGADEEPLMWATALLAIRPAAGAVALGIASARAVAGPQMERDDAGVALRAAQSGWATAMSAMLSLARES